MAKNKLTDLNDHLFVALERLNDENLSQDDLEKEVKRAKSITSISGEIIKVNNIYLTAAISIAKGDIDLDRLPENFEVKRIADKK